MNSHGTNQDAECTNHVRPGLNLVQYCLNLVRDRTNRAIRCHTHVSHHGAIQNSSVVRPTVGLTRMCAIESHISGATHETARVPMYGMSGTFRNRPVCSQSSRKTPPSVWCARWFTRLHVFHTNFNVFHTIVYISYQFKHISYQFRYKHIRIHMKHMWWHEIDACCTKQIFSLLCEFSFIPLT